MSTSTMRAQDVIYGALGRCYATIDGKREEMLYVKNIEAIIKKTKCEIPVLGQTGKKHRSGGWAGNGVMTMYYATSVFRRMMLNYAKTGLDTYFDLIVENEDPTSSIGKQTILLRGVNIDSVVMAKLDIGSEALDERVTFTFDGVEILGEFTGIGVE